jgi:hypothetical protein
VSVTGRQRKLHNGKLHNLHSSPYIIWLIKSRRMKLKNLRMHERSADILIEKAGRNITLATSRFRWENSIEITLIKK